MKPQHHHPVDDVSLDQPQLLALVPKALEKLSPSMGNQSTRALRLQSRPFLPGSWAEVGVDPAFPGYFCSLWEKEPQVVPVNTPVPVEEQPCQEESPRLPGPLLGEVTGGQENICEKKFF